jgi:hypothetical protein
MAFMFLMNPSFLYTQAPSALLDLFMSCKYKVVAFYHLCMSIRKAVFGYSFDSYRLLVSGTKVTSPCINMPW